MSTPTAYESWAWARFLERLERAGYTIVKKPTLGATAGPKPWSELRPRPKA